MVKMTLGQYQSRVAGNGRVAIPKKFRDELGNKYIITQGYENSLLVVPEEKWESVVSQAGSKKLLMGEARDTTRFLLGGASAIDLDEQGRFVIPTYLRKYAKIESEVVFLGLGGYFEVWDSAVWKTYQKKMLENIESVAQKLSELKE